MEADKHTGSIQTHISYNDPRTKTEVDLETFEFNGFTIWLPHPIGEGERKANYVSVDTDSGYNVFIQHDRIEISSPSGFTVVDETFESLVDKCRIAENLSAVNKWK